MAEAAKAPERHRGARGLRGGHRAQDGPLLGVSDPAALLRQLAGHARPPAGARPVVRHRRPDGVQRAVHGADGAARRAALPVDPLTGRTSGRRRSGSPFRKAEAGVGATPILHFFNKEVPYDKIAAVETRSVLFGNAMAPVLLRATRLLLKDGEHVRLGSVNEDNVDAALPFPEIGAKIAQRAGVAVVDAGTVRRSIEKPVLKFFGRKTPTEYQPAAHRGREGGDQLPPFPRREISRRRAWPCWWSPALPSTCSRRRARPLQDLGLRFPQAVADTEGR